MKYQRIRLIHNLFYLDRVHQQRRLEPTYHPVGEDGGHKQARRPGRHGAKALLPRPNVRTGRNLTGLRVHLKDA